MFIFFLLIALFGNIPDYGSVLLFLIPFGLGILIYLVLLNKHRDQRLSIEQKMPESQKRISYYQSLINTISQEADPILKQFPAGYNTLDALTYMVSMLEQKRALTYPEAAAMYDEYAHRRRMEELQVSQLNEQRKQTNIQQVQAAAQVVQTVATVKGFSDIKKKLDRR